MGDRRVTPSKEAIDDAVTLIAKAKRPIVIVGYGARGAMDSITEIAVRLGAPVLTTFKAKGLIPEHLLVRCWP